MVLASRSNFAVLVPYLVWNFGLVLLDLFESASRIFPGASGAACLRASRAHSAAFAWDSVVIASSNVENVFRNLSFLSTTHLNELAAQAGLQTMMSRYSISAKNVGSTQVAFGFLIGLVSLALGLTTVSSFFRISLETVRDQPVPTLPM